MSLVPGVHVAPLLLPDLVDVNLRLVVECDSFAHHGERDAFTRDIERYNTLVRLGWQVLRIAWEHAQFNPDHVKGLLADRVVRPWTQELRVS
jgi:very-short-patch-repair endonuclease